MPEPSGKEVFISYCHDDNDEVLGDQWVEQFHRYLATRLRQILGRGNEPGIWRDKELQGNQDFASVLSEELKAVAILISVITPSYIGSEWCQREIDEFVNAAKANGGLKIGNNQERIFKVEKTPVPREEHPTVLRDQTGYPFYIFDKEKGRPSELSLSPDDPKKNAIAKERIDDLAYHIVATLEALKSLSVGKGSEETIAPAAETKSIDEGKPVVYLAETSFDLRDELMKVRRELESQGYRVLPEGDLPIRDPELFNNAVNEALAQSQLSIHMIGSVRAIVPAGETDDVVVLQNNLAAQRSSVATLNRLIWLPVDVSSVEENHQQFIDKLHRDPDTQGSADLLQIPLQELMTSVLGSLQKLQIGTTQQAEEKPNAGPKQIYVCYSAEDKQAAAPILDYLFEKGFEVLEPLLTEDASDEQVVEIHKRNLTDCDATLLFCERSGEFWLKAQMNEFRKAPHYRSNRKLLASAVFLGPSMFDITMRTQDLVLQGEEEFSPATLEPFVNKLTETDGDQS